MAMGTHLRWHLFLMVSLADSFLYNKNIVIKGDDSYDEYMYEYDELYDPEIHPIDKYVFVGEQLNMTCTLGSSAIGDGYNSSAINFSYGEDIPIPEEETFIINSTTRGLTLNIVSVYEYEHMAYHCNFGPPSYYNMDSTTVVAEYPPQPVQNFTCIIYDWDEKMECSWSLGVSYKNLKNINVSLVLGNSGYCPNMQLLNCTWLNSDGKTFDRSLLSFQINVTNTKRQVVSGYQDWIEIKQNDYVKPSRISSLTKNVVTSRCVELEWEHSRKYRPKLFIIELTSKWGDYQINETAKFRTSFCDLRPNTEYDISIVTRPGGNPGDNKGYPSDPFEDKFTTEIDVPESPPEIDLGNFYISSDYCSVLDQRTVTVYWKELAEIDKNGPGVQYCMKVQDKETITTRLTYRSLTIPCTQDVTVSIWSRNKHGPSEVAVEFVIPKADVISLPSHIIVEAVNTSTDTAVTVSWTSADDPRVTNYTVYYCQYDTECVNNIEWITVPSTSHTVTLTQFMFDKKNRFGVSANTDMYSSGFKWEQCYYLKSEAPSAPEVIDVQAYPEDAITVDWSEPECGRSPYIMFYIVKWCIVSGDKKSCNDIADQVNISSTLPPKFVIHDLKARTTYGVQVAYSTADGRVAYSELIKAEPTNNDLAGDEIAGISIAAVFVVCLAIAGIIFCCRRICYCCKKIQKPYEITNIAIKPHQMRNLEEQNTGSTRSSSSTTSSTESSSSKLIKDSGKSSEYLGRQISKDSGRGSVTSEGLQSPSFNIGRELKPVQEELNPYIDRMIDAPTMETEIDSGYSKITNDDENLVTNPDLMRASVQSRSLPHLPEERQSYGRESVSSQKLSNNTISSYKSSSEEIMLNLGLCDQDGYVDDPKSKSLQALEEHPDESALSSYVKQGPDFDQSFTSETSEGRPCIDPDILPAVTGPPLLETEDLDGSSISMISSGCLDSGAINVVLTPELKGKENNVSKDGYQRWDPIENPTFSLTSHECEKPLMCTNDYESSDFNNEKHWNSNQSLGSENQSLKDYLPEEVAKNLINEENSKLLGNRQNHVNLGHICVGEDSPNISEATLKTDASERNSEKIERKENSDYESDYDESKTLLPSNQINGYIKHADLNVNTSHSNGYVPHADLCL